MELRPYRAADCAQLAALFHDTVYAVNARDYTREQLDAWAGAGVDLDVWNRSLLEHSTVVAVEGAQIVGFGDMDASGYLDRLYVHKDFQGRGIATAICDALEAMVWAECCAVHASITAKPFFAGRGYRMVREQTVERRGVLLRNYRMEKETARGRAGDGMRLEGAGQSEGSAGLNPCAPPEG